MTKPENGFIFSKLLFWMQFIFFGGWNGLQILLQPQDLSILVAERGLLNNYYFTMSYSWKNIPLIYLILFAIAIFWNYRAIALDQQLINKLKKKDDIAVIPYRDKDDIVVFITILNVLNWIFCIWLIYLIPYWDMSFFNNLIYDISGINSFKEPLYILLILITASINLTLRIQLLLFYEGGIEYLAISKFLKSFSLMKTYYIKTFLITLLATTLSLLVYKQLILGLFMKFGSSLSDNVLVNFPLMVNRSDVLSAIPSFILLFLLSCLLFSPIVSYVYHRIVNSQYEFYKNQFIKQKTKKDIDDLTEAD